MLITKNVNVYFIACNRALCCSGLYVCVLSTSGQIQVQMAVSLWPIRNFRHRRSDGRRGKGVSESGSARYISEPAQKNARWRIRVPLKHRVHDTEVCRIAILCASKDFHWTKRRFEVIFWDTPYISRSVVRNDCADSVGKPKTWTLILMK